jgi:peptidoglycan/LPS O-acetylase OafA/YrhL
MDATTVPPTTMTSTTATPPSKSRVPELDGLRGIAISLVLILHFSYFNPAPDHYPTEWIKRLLGPLGRFAAFGWSGVDLFFVLSGFLIGGILLDARGSPNYFKTFYVRRVFRIFPIYYLWILAYTILALLLGARLRGPLSLGPVPLRTVSIYYLFLQDFSWRVSTKLTALWLGPLWSLAVEEQFYILAPFAIRYLPRKRLVTALLAAVAIAPALRILAMFLSRYHMGLQGLMYKTMPCRMDSLAFGVLCAVIWRSPKAVSWISRNRFGMQAALLTLVGGYLAIAALNPEPLTMLMAAFGFSWIAVTFACLLLVVMTERASWLAGLTRMAWLRELGKVSYCVYMIHGVVGSFCGMLFGVLRRAGSGRSLASNCVAIVVSYAIARVSWDFFENPLLRKGHKYKY